MNKRLRTLRDYREQHQMSQRDAARKFGVTQGAWSRWERGTQRPNRRMAAKLMAVTNVPLEVLMGMAS